MQTPSLYLQGYPQRGGREREKKKTRTRKRYALLYKIDFSILGIGHLPIFRQRTQVILCRRQVLGEVLRWVRGGNGGEAIIHRLRCCLSYALRIVLVWVARVCCRTTEIESVNEMLPHFSGLFISSCLWFEFPNTCFTLNAQHRALRKEAAELSRYSFPTPILRTAARKSLLNRGQWDCAWFEGLLRGLQDRGFRE